MTEEEVRIIVRSELGRMFARAVSVHATMPHVEPNPIEAWLETLPIGEEGLARDWLERYRTETGDDSGRSAISFGSSLRMLSGDLVSRRKGRTGIFSYVRIERRRHPEWCCFPSRDGALCAAHLANHDSPSAPST